jgi:hypothetical protein
MTQNNSRFGKNSKAQRMQMFGNDISRSSGGQYVLSATSGLLTGVAAQTSSAGHVAAFRNGSSSLAVVVNRIHARWWTTTGATSAQEIGLGLIMARSYTAAHTGGTAATLTTNNGKKHASHATISTDLDFRIGDTGALTAGTHTFDAQNFIDAGSQELADGASVVKKAFEINYAPADGRQLVLSQNEGIVLRNRIAMGTALVARVSMMIEFELVDAEDAYLQ